MTDVDRRQNYWGPPHRAAP